MSKFAYYYISSMVKISVSGILKKNWSDIEVTKFVTFHCWLRLSKVILKQKTEQNYKLKFLSFTYNSKANKTFTK